MKSIKFNLLASVYKLPVLQYYVSFSLHAYEPSILHFTAGIKIIHCFGGLLDIKYIE